MKINLFLSFALLFIGLTSNAQICGNVANQIDIDRLLSNKKAVANGISVKNGVTIYIPVTFHIVRETNGSDGITEDFIAQQLCALNNDYESMDIVFYLKDKTFNYVNNSTLYDNPTSSSSGTKMSIEKSGAGKNSVNVFITKTAQTGGLGTTLGYYDPSLDLIVMRKDQINSNSGTLSHEMGHFFSLLHVFNGWDQVAWDEDIHGNPVNSQYSPGNVLNELADGSNCENSGDFLCDTPADYNLGFTWSGCSNYGGGCKDFAGDELNPQENNFMSYFIGCDKYVFTDMQTEMVLADYNSPARNFLKVGYTPNTNDISSTTLTSPEDGEVMPGFNDIKLEWESVENAIGYVVSLKRALTETKFFVNDNFVVLDDLDGGKKYQWRIFPVSEIGGCQNFTSFQEFTSGTISGIEDLEIDEIELVSTFITNNSLFFESSTNDKINIQIFDISGNAIITANQRFSEGINQVDISPEIASGMYFIRLTDSQNRSKTIKAILNN